VFLPNLFVTQVLRLSNMVTRDDLYNEAEYRDIIEDVRLECLQYGQVSLRGMQVRDLHRRGSLSTLARSDCCISTPLCCGL
jgi:hypothetical protein